MFTEGHIKVKRTIKEWGWYHDPKMFTLFVHLLLDANFKDGEWEGHIIKRGQLVTSVHLLSVDTGLSIQEVRTCLRKLGGSGEVRSTSIGRRSIITICNYDYYQDDQQGSNKDSTGLQQGSNNHATSKQRPIIEESKKAIKKETNEKKSSNDDKERLELAEKLYAIYPTKCPMRGTSTGKSSQDKKKIASLLKDHTFEELESIFKRYVDESLGKAYLKNFSTFLNNLPDYTDSRPSTQGDLFAQTAPQQEPSSYAAKKPEDNVTVRPDGTKVIKMANGFTFTGR